MKYTLWILSAVLVVAGGGLISEGTNLPTLRDEAEFQRLYMLIDSRRPDAGQVYQRLRAEFMTNREAFENYGGTLVLGGILLPLLPCAGAALRRYSGRVWALVVLGLVAATASPVAEFLSLALESSRGRFPWFADSLIIPLMVLPVSWALLLVWESLLVWLAVRSHQVPAGKVGPWFRRTTKFFAALALLQLLLAVCHGDFLSIVPLVLWFVFYCAIVMHPPAGTGSGHDWRRHGPWWGAIVGGLVAPLALFAVAKAVGDTGGPLFWPVLALALGSLGTVVGLAARPVRPRVREPLGGASETASD